MVLVITPFTWHSVHLSSLIIFLSSGQISRLSLGGGTRRGKMIRRMLAAVVTNALAFRFNVVTNALAFRFNWTGKSPKRDFKETLMQDCVFGELVD